MCFGKMSIDMKNNFLDYLLKVDELRTRFYDGLTTMKFYKFNKDKIKE